MNKLMKFIEEKIGPFANAMGSQRHMRAVRNGIIATLPLTIVGSFFVVFLNVPINGYAEIIAPFRNALDVPFRYTVGIMSLYAAFGIASSLAKSYKLDELSSGFLAVVAFLISSAVPVRTAGAEGVIAAGRWLPIGKLSAAGLFGAIVASIVSVEIYRFMKEKNIVVKMPEGVPPAVANSFSALLPTIVVILLFWVIRYTFNFDISQFLSMLIMPLKNVLAGNSLLGGLLTVFLIVFFWMLGIHGPAILGPVVRPIWDTAIAENMEAFANGVPADQLPNIFTEQFLQWFVWVGGAGTTLALVLLFMVSKSKYLKQLGRLSFIPGLFNINEPIIFGAPIVMNPILCIPFIVAPLVTTTIAYTFHKLGLIPLMMARLPFTVPAPLAAVISTDWAIMSGVLVIINFIVSLAIYYPFFKQFEKEQLANELAEENLIAKKA